jgi:hypothetical protein
VLQLGAEINLALGSVSASMNEPVAGPSLATNKSRHKSISHPSGWRCFRKLVVTQADGLKKHTIHHFRKADANQLP